MAGGVVLQVDQAAPPNQGFLRDQPECCEDPNLDCRIGLRARRHHPQAAHAADQPLPDSTDFERYAFRENAHSTGTSAIRLPRESTRLFQSVESVQLIAGQQWTREYASPARSKS
jgi:hypothetical protein